MRYIIFILSALISLIVYGNEISENFIVCKVYGDSSGSESKLLQTNTYYDGIGRKIMDLQKGLGVNGEDVVIKTEYDARGNIGKKWMPLPMVTGSINYDYYGSNENPYKQYNYHEYIGYEISEVSLPGKLWNSHKIKCEYLSNDSVGELSCILIKVNQDGSLISNGFYKKGTLQVFKSIDTEGRAYYEFYDRNERKILSRVVSKNLVSDTRYIYDTKGDLRYTISPQGMLYVPVTGDISDDVLKQYGNYYLYDFHHRLIEKRIAGTEPREYVYDRLDRLILNRDSSQRKNNEWTLTKYDKKGHKIQEGTVTSSDSRNTMQSLYGDSLIEEDFIKNANIAESQMLYTDKTGPRGFKPYMAWYYDNYEFTLDKNFNKVPGFTTTSSLPSTGLCTGSAQLCNNSVWFTKIEYDYRGLPIYECTYDLFENDSRITKCYEYDFRGNLETKYEKVEDMIEGSVIDSRYAIWKYTLDAADRIKFISLSVNGNPFKQIQQNEYDEIGRLKAVTSGVKTEYTYDAQSNIVQIMSPHYVQKLYYAQNPFNSENVCYDGNVCASTQAYRDEELQVADNYDYHYDAFGRLSSAITTDKMVKELSEYDLNSNILSLQRYFDGSKVQDAVMEYDGNKIMTVYDVSETRNKEYIPSFFSGNYSRTYMSNGNLYTDETRGITSISYNKINLPKKINFNNGNSVTTDYMPDGTLMHRSFNSRVLQTTIKVNPVTGDTIVRQRYVTQSEIHKYRGDFECIGNKWRLHTEVGYYDILSNQNHYYVKDNQGSIVTVVSENGSIEEQTAYYPTGVPYRIFDRQPVTDRKHIGNEWLAFNGLNTYDNTARYHYPIIPSYDTIDPNAEDYPGISPYTHCAGNPRNVIDPSGMDTISINYDGEKFSIIGIVLKEGDDVFNITINGEVKTVKFSEGEYGNRVCMLNLVIKGKSDGDYALGVYNVSRQNVNGFYVTPGGDPSVALHSNKRIPEGVYQMCAPFENAQWRQPGLSDKEIASRGIRFHYGRSRQASKGCFILSSDYKINNDNSISFDETASKNAVKEFDMALGATKIFPYVTSKGNTRIGAEFPKGIKHKLVLKTL